MGGLERKGGRGRRGIGKKEDRCGGVRNRWEGVEDELVSG